MGGFANDRALNEMTFGPVNVPAHQQGHGEAERRFHQTFGNLLGGPTGGPAGGANPFGGLYDGPSIPPPIRDPYAPFSTGLPHMPVEQPIPVGPLSTSSRGHDAARVGQHLPDRPSVRPPSPAAPPQPDMVFTPREVGIPDAGGPDMVFTPSEVERANRAHRPHHHHHHHRQPQPDMVFTPREVGIPDAGGPDMVFTPSEVERANHGRP